MNLHIKEAECRYFLIGTGYGKAWDRHGAFSQKFCIFGRKTEVVMYRENLKLIRELMARENIDFWYVSGSDPHQSEYVAERWRSRAWLSGFTGSAGRIIISQDMAGLWTDSRYYLQATAQLANSGFTLFKDGMPEVPNPEQWLKNNFKAGQCLGFDAATVSREKYTELKQLLADLNASFYTSDDLVQKIWTDRPEMPATRVWNFPVEYCGVAREEKLKTMRERMNTLDADAILLASLDDIAWLLNYRGSDVDFSPVALAYFLLKLNTADLYIVESRLEADLAKQLKQAGVKIHPYEDAANLDRELTVKEKILLDPKRIPVKMIQGLPTGVRVKEIRDISTDMKAVKNETELAGMKSSHVQDGAAMVKWWLWFESNIGRIPMDEINITDTLAEYRSQGVGFEGLSFSPIAGFGANGAIVHYSATPSSAARITENGILLLDSGGHYLTGTTDITRTFAVGKPGSDEKKHYTLVLKGHLALAAATFPKGTTGSRLELLARQPLWKQGLNYGHGTGHGVGHYLNVHEGPAGISPLNHLPLEKGMVLSNEPGLYFEGAYGIRIENMVAVKDSSEFPGFLSFENLTCFPYDLNLIDESLLSPEEKEQINRYHRFVRKSLDPWLNEEEKTFLAGKTNELN